MATQSSQANRGVTYEEDPKGKIDKEVSAGDLVLRHFQGVNQQSPREDIEDGQFYWLEELIPIAAGNLALVRGPGALLTTVVETGAPSYAIEVNIAGVDYQFAVWSNSGNAWLINQTNGAKTAVATGLYTSGQTAATQWNNLGLVIVDAVKGLRDWNITPPNTLTNLSGQVYAPTLQNPAPTPPIGVPSLAVVDAGPGTGALALIAITASAAAVPAGFSGTGSGYLVGDVITLVGGTLVTVGVNAPTAYLNQPTVLQVTAVGGTGNITGVSFVSQGYYYTQPNPNHVSVTGGTGTLAAFDITWQYAAPWMEAPGQNYLAPSLQIGGIASSLITFSTTGTVLGTQVAVYAGRIWVAIKRTVQFTDIDSYSSFGGAGGSFTINDDYLHNNITVLSAANNYLYIFGDDSLDILSNVAVSSSGLTTFSRLNVSASIGCTQPQSVFPFQRSLAFSNTSGFYVVAGATPEKISDDLDTLMASVNFNVPVYGAQIMIGKILCAAFLINFQDSFVNNPTVTRSMLCVYFRGKWWFTSQKQAAAGLNTLTSNPVQGVSTPYGWVGNVFYPLMAATNINNWLLKTKLWDMGAPMLDKQGLKAAIGLLTSTGFTPGLTLNVDNENTSLPTAVGGAYNFVQFMNNFGAILPMQNNSGQIVQFVSNGAGLYQLLIGTTNIGGGKFIGITASGTNSVAQIRLLALLGQKRRPW